MPLKGTRQREDQKHQFFQSSCYNFVKPYTLRAYIPIRISKQPRWQIKVKLTVLLAKFKKMTSTLEKKSKNLAMFFGNTLSTIFWRKLLMYSFPANVLSWISAITLFLIPLKNLRKANNTIRNTMLKSKYFPLLYEYWHSWFWLDLTYCNQMK